MMKIFLLVFVVLISCSGYKATNLDNPFKEYGIRSVSVPMFYNHSNISELHHLLNSEFVRFLRTFSGLDVRVGEDKTADAYLIGVVRSEDQLAKTYQARGVGAKRLAPRNVGDREDFFIQNVLSFRPTLQLVLIKRPSPEQVELLTSDIGEKIPSLSTIVFNQSIGLSGSYVRTVRDQEAGSINMTQSFGALRKTKENMAKSAVNSFKNQILYVF